MWPRAGRNQNKFINQAEAYANDFCPGPEARRLKSRPRRPAYREEKIKRAQGDASRFLSVLKEYQKAKDVTKKRLYLETMEEILSHAQKIHGGWQDQRRHAPFFLSRA